MKNTQIVRFKDANICKHVTIQDSLKRRRKDDLEWSRGGAGSKPSLS